MELHQLRYFARVADLGHFTKAAEACCVSQPSLSQQIAKLEQELGVALFERLPRGIRLTEAGRRLRPIAEQMLRLHDEARAVVADEPDAGRVTAAAIPTVAPYLLPPLLAAFAAECPRATVNVAEETTERCLDMLARGDADVAFLALPVTAEGVVTRTLLSEALLAALPAAHPLASRRSLTLDDLAGEPFVLLHDAHCLTGTALGFCRSRGVEPGVSARIHQLATALELVRLGRGVTLVPEMAARADGDDRRVYLPLDDGPRREVALAWSTRRYRTKVVQRFAEMAAGSA